MHLHWGVEENAVKQGYNRTTAPGLPLDRGSRKGGRDLVGTAGPPHVYEYINVRELVKEGKPPPTFSPTPHSSAVTASSQRSEPQTLRMSYYGYSYTGDDENNIDHALVAGPSRSQDWYVNPAPEVEDTRPARVRGI